jgi:hypothetical protein
LYADDAARAQAMPHGPMAVSNNVNPAAGMDSASPDRETESGQPSEFRASHPEIEPTAFLKSFGRREAQESRG